MRFTEFCQLNERISFTEHHDDVLYAISDGILKTIYELSDDLGGEEFEEFKKVPPNTDPSDYLDVFLKKLRGFLPDYFQIHLKRNLEDTLSTAARNIVGVGSPGRWVQVQFKDTRSNLGWAESDTNIVGLSETKYLDEISKGLRDNLDEILLDNWDGSNDIVKWAQSMIQMIQRDRMLQAELVLGRSGAYVYKMASTILHELVHIKQHMLQHKKGRDKTEYRSYLQRSPEQFSQAYQDGTSPEWYRLHASSPQEIGSYIHNIAIEIQRDFGFDDAMQGGYIPEKIEPKTIMSYVRDHFVSRIGEPRTPKEKMVLKRYAKGVYLEVEKYRQNIIKSIKSQEQSKDRTAPQTLGAQIKSRLGTHPAPQIPKQ